MQPQQQYNNRNQQRPRQPQEPKEFDEQVIKVNRVSKKTKGGSTMGFSTLVVVGNKKGQVGVGMGKGRDVASSIRKGVSYARRHLITVNMKNTTIPHEITHKYGAARVLLKPASTGAGLIAGGPVRAVVAAAGIKDIVGKIMGSRNAISNAYCAFEALKHLKPNPDRSHAANADTKTSKTSKTKSEKTE